MYCVLGAEVGLQLDGGQTWQILIRGPSQASCLVLSKNIFYVSVKYLILHVIQWHVGHVGPPSSATDVRRFLRRLGISA